MSYIVKNVFRTIQGEGAQAGSAVVFVRLAACNMWSGNEADRERDAERNGARCPLWCDTDFNGGTRMTAEEVLRCVLACAGPVRSVVISGGEPLLQIDDELLSTLTGAGISVAIETNGTVPYKGSAEVLQWCWVTLSPKRSRERTALQSANELKLVWPAHDPSDWESFDAGYLFIQPLADKDERDTECEREAAAWVMAHPRWRLSVQLHKVLGVE